MAPIIRYGGATSGSGNNSTSGTFSVSGLTFSAGDIAVCCWYSFDATKRFTGSAALWSALTHIGSGSNAGTGSYYLGYRILQAGDTTWTWGANSVSSATTVWGTALFLGVLGTTSVLEAQSSVTTFSDVNDPNPPAVTPVGSGSCIITFFGKMNDYTAVTPPSNYLYAVSHSSTSGNDASMGLAYRILTINGGGAEDPGAWTLTGGASTDDGYVWTASLKTGSNPPLFRPYMKCDGFTYRYQASPTPGR